MLFSENSYVCLFLKKYTFSQVYVQKPVTKSRTCGVMTPVLSNTLDMGILPFAEGLFHARFEEIILPYNLKNV